MTIRWISPPRATVFAVLTLAFVAIPAVSQEEKIRRSDLPAAVAATVAAQSQGSTVRGFSKEREKGQTYYEAELEVGVDTKGNVVEVEEEVAMDALPATVRDGLWAKAAGATLAKVESLTKLGKLVAYEAQVVAKGKKSEIQVGPDGKTLDHLE